jgi:hypothetical protein
MTRGPVQGFIEESSAASFAAVMSNRLVTQLIPARILSNAWRAERHSILVLRH